MHLVTATLKIYRDAALTAGRAFTRSAWALLALLLMSPALVLVTIAVAPMGFFGGLIVSLVTAAAAGTYMGTLQDALAARKSMGPDVLRANLARYTWDIIGVLFPLWILSLLLQLAGVPSVVTLVVEVALFVACNPVPEMVGRARSGGVELLRDAGRYMLDNGLEWFLPQAALVGVLWLVVPIDVTELLGLFGPRFGFVHAGSLPFGMLGRGAVSWALGLGLVAAVHLVMLFRGALYERLGSGGRRARAWRERAG